MVVRPFEVLDRGFPGPRLAGVALILGPALLLAGAILMIPFEGGSFEERQAALAEQPARAMWALELFMAGWMATIVTIVALATLIRSARPVLGLLAGIAAVAGVTVSLFFGGVMSYEVGLAGLSDRDAAAEVQEGSLAPLVILLSGAGIVGGWLLMGWGSYKAQVMPAWRAVAVGMVALLPVTVLGGFPYLMPLPFLGMGVGLLPLGMELLRPGGHAADPTTSINGGS